MRVNLQLLFHYRRERYKLWKPRPTKPLKISFVKCNSRMRTDPIRSKISRNVENLASEAFFIWHSLSLSLSLSLTLSLSLSLSLSLLLKVSHDFMLYTVLCMLCIRKIGLNNLLVQKLLITCWWSWLQGLISPNFDCQMKRYQSTESDKRPNLISSTI